MFEINGLAEGLVSSGRVADLALVVLAVEALVLWFAGPRAEARSRLFRAWPFFVAGAGLILALRAALTGAPWWCVAGALGLAGVANAVDLSRRLRG